MFCGVIGRKGGLALCASGEQPRNLGLVISMRRGVIALQRSDQGWGTEP